MEKNIIIDGHSHCGLDIFHGKTEIDEYIHFAKKSGINIGLIMGVPSPCRDLKDINSRYMYWTFNGKNINYHGEANPFLGLNYNLYDLLKAKSTSTLKLVFIPTFHPIMDTSYKLEELIERTDPVALKIHGIGSGIGPNDISNEFIKIIKKYNLPLILHTDYDAGQTKDLSMVYVRNSNDSKKWAEFLIKNEIYGTLNHGASLNLETFELTNKTEFIKIALGPDRVACLDKNRLHIDCLKDYRNYLQYLKKYLETDKIIYDADYNWNSLSGDDFESVIRVKEIFTTEESQKQIFSENILKHYPRLIKKIKE